MDNQHVTLKFLGWAAEDALAAIEHACEVAAASHGVSELRLGDSGAFPNPRRMRVLWVGLDDPAELLTRVAHDLDQAFEPLGFATETRAFTPHLTLARFKVPRPLGDVAVDLAGLEAFPVEGFDLWRSHLHPRGARYERLRTFGLGD